MISIILFSSLLSVVTLGILFFQRISPEKIKIPSWFLGAKSERRLSEIKSKPPLWWEVVAVLFFTLGCCLAYYSQVQDSTDKKIGSSSLVWFDPTLSHIHALRSSSAARESVLNSLRDLRVSHFDFIELKFQKNEDNLPQPTYELNRVPADGLASFMEKALANPSALSQPLNTQQLKTALERDKALDLRNIKLTLVTDAQAETVRPLTGLATTFESVNVIRTPYSDDEKSASLVRTPLVPEELASMWRRTNEESDQDVPLSTPQFIKMDAETAAKIPLQARPSLFLEEYFLRTGSSNEPSRLSTISGLDATGSDPAGASRGNRPLITTCTLSVAGPSELDGLSDLRAYAQFFKIPIRPMACRSTASATSASSVGHTDPWKYRRASVWVVPVNESVAGELFQQGLHWIPEGFSPQHDALIYIADTRLLGVEGLMESVSVQLEANQPSVRLPLLPVPPQQLVFPWDLRDAQRPVRTKPIRTDVTNAQPVVLSASDATQLAFALSEQPPVIYLRTGGAASNGELGRWGQWANLWSTLSQRLTDVSPTLSKLQFTSGDDWSKWFSEQKKSQSPRLRYVVSGENLKARLIDSKEILSPTPALYIRERDDQMLLVEPPLSEKVSETLTAAEIVQLFQVTATQADLNQPVKSGASVLQWTGSLLALFSVLLLWVVQERKSQPRTTTQGVATTLPLFLAFVLLSAPSHAFAQSARRPPFDARTLRPLENRPDTTNLPFRVGWCEASIPDSVKQRWRQLQSLLAGRGTIELPRELSPGACQLGASEIWWSSSLEALQAAPVTQHIRSGGIVIAEGVTLKQPPEWMLGSADASIGLTWESPKRRGLLYRSFYLLSSFDACTPERTLLLTLRKKVNAQAPMGIVTPIRFLSKTNELGDCFAEDEDYRSRSFVNLMYALLTTDYKEDQLQLPEILNRVRNLGLEP